jgi:hypothetical protein
VKTRLLVVFSLIVVSTFAQTLVAPGSKVFIAQMGDNLNNYIAAEIIKQKVPLTVVTDQTQADFALTGGSHVIGQKTSGNGSILYPVRERTEYGAAISMTSVKSTAVVWAGDADGSKVKQLAEKIIKKMNKDVFGKK